MAAAGSGRAIVVGATGLVGAECVRRFATAPAFASVLALVRRDLPAALRLSKVEQRIVDFEALDRVEVGAATHVVCALGTTIRQAGSQERFRRVDHDYVLAAARLGRRLGAHHFLLVSALGADAGARVFYNRVKGETEAGVRGVGYPSVTIVRPSLLLGERQEFRLGEQVAKVLGVFAPGKLRPVRAADVATTLLHAALEDRPGVRVIESDEIRRIARAAPAAA